MIRTVAILILAALAAPAEAGEVSTTEQRLEDGTRILRQEIVVDAPVEEVWAAFTTSEGWESWAVPFAHVDLKVGGIIETSYDANAERGDPANIQNRILSYLPFRMLSIQAVKAPPEFAHADLLHQLHSVIEFEALDDAQTRVAISGVGYREGDGYDQLLGFFRQGNAWTFERLRQRFEDEQATNNNKGKE